MGRGKELSPQLRSRLCELKSIGWNARRIHAHHPELSLNTIRSTLRREPERNNNASRPRSGRPAKLTDAHIERLRAVLAANPNANSRELLDQVDHVVQKRTIQRIVRDMMVAGRGSNPRQGKGQGNGHGQGNGQTVQRKRQVQIQRPRAALVSSPHNNGECGNAATVVTAAAAAVASGTPGASASPASSIQVPAPVSASTSASMPMVASTTPAAPAPSLSSPSGSAPASVPMPMPMPIQMPMQM